MFKDKLVKVPVLTQFYLAEGAETQELQFPEMSKVLSAIAVEMIYYQDI